MIDTILFIAMVMAALWAVLARSLLKATIGLAVTSAIVTIIMFRLNSPLAAVFELSVCTGLITVVFVSAISLTKPLTHKETLQVSRERMKKYWYLPVIMILAGAALSFVKVPALPGLPQEAVEMDARNVLWNMRQLDLFGQILLILAGAFGIVILFKEKIKK